MKHIIVTGGSGYIGSHTVTQLLERHQYLPVSLDNYSNSTESTYKRIAQICGQKPIYHYIELGNLDEIRRVFSSIPNIDGVIHFAALKSVGDSVKKPLHYYKNNILSLLNILTCIDEFSVPHFIFSSSCSIYGNIDKLPVQETSTSSPQSPYAYTKHMGEQIIQDFYHHRKDLSCVMLRYFNPVGAHESGLNGERSLEKPNNLVPVICQAACGIIKEMEVFGYDYNTRDGSCIRDYIHVDDIARAHLLALDYLTSSKAKQNCSVFNLGSGRGVSVLEMIKTFEKINGVSVPYKLSPRREGDVEAIYSDSSLAKQELGWVPQKSLEDMMKSAWQWQLNLSKLSA